MTLFEPTIEVEPLKGRGCTYERVYVDGVHLGDVYGARDIAWTARHPGYQALERRFATKAECIAWLVAGSPLPAVGGLCNELRPFHPHVHCTKPDGHARRHHYAEPVSRRGKEQRRAARAARRAA